MRALVVGGSGSGKSAFAENLACSLSPQRTYAATMTGNDPEAQDRIARHRKQRAHMGFRTIECAGSIATEAFNPQQDDIVLLDDLGNLVSNALFLENGRMPNPNHVLERLDHELEELSARHRHVVVVAPLAGSEGPSAYESTRTWLRVCGTLCCRLAARFETVIEVACGIPCAVKGALP